MSIVRNVFVLGALGALPWMSQAQTVAGRSPGSFSVSESGAATYSIPIQVPPGIAGIEPRLAIAYNSQGGNGLLGVGWGLSGLSTVTRCPMSYAQDGVKGGVNFDWNDRFCLDGQRLVAISGTYGTDGTEYRTERESFTRVISYSSPAYVGWFKAWTKAGQTTEYTAFVDNATATSRMLWGLSRVQDTVGNYLTVSYVADTANHVHYPSRIDYTGNARSGQAPANSVRFEYEGRLDAPTLYQAGTGMREPMRLSRVRTYVGEMLVREYRLAYDNAGAVGRSRLVSVTECEAAGSCLPPISLQWSSSNGDGAFTTPVYSYPGWDFGANPSYWQRITGDFNGDGKTDFARVGPTYAHIFLSNGDGSFSTPVFSFPGWNFGADPNYWQMITGDFDGDGKTGFARLGPTYAHVFLSAGTIGDLATSIGDGLGSVYSITYKPLTDSSVYAKDAGAVYPVLDRQVPMYVVSSVSASNGLGGSLQTNYRYSGLRSHALAGSSLGFGGFEASDPQTGIRNITRFRRDYPFHGLVESAFKLKPGDSDLQRITNTWSDAVFPNATGKYHRSDLTQSVQTGADLNGAALPTVTTSTSYDAFGNAAGITVTTGDGYTKATTNTYTNDATNWFLGRLIRSQVMSTTP